MDRKKIGVFLKQLREEKGFTQNKFARTFSEKCFGDLILSDAAVSKWERGESVPNIGDIQRLADFYGVTIDEILNGEKFTCEDLDKKYFLSNPQWAMDAPREVNLYEIREKQELEIETRFKMLLKKMISEGLTLSENAEFDYLLEKFYTNNESGDIAVTVKDIKFQIYKIAASMRHLKLDETFWEVYKLFRSRFMQTVKIDVSDAIGGAENILRERVCNLEIFEKDMLLAAIQVENVTNWNSMSEFNEERQTKRAIKLLVDCGARLNPLLLGYQRNKVITIDILDKLIELYNKFKKPFVIAIYEEQTYNFFEIENTPSNRKEHNFNDSGETLDESEYSDLERRLYNGERILEKVIPEWVGGNNEDEMIKHMRSVICALPFKKYLSARDERLTDELVNRLDEFSLEDIRRTYFIRRQDA